MTHRRFLVCSGVCVVILAGVLGLLAVDTVTASGSSSEDEPLADAGLDQKTPPGAVVYLDAGGSVAPDGELMAFEWEIERPDGTTTTPECTDCEQTQFQPEQVGEYAVTVTVTDDDGRSASDTLFVTVLDYEFADLSVSGPETVDIGEEATFEMDAQAGERELSSLSWLVDGETEEATFADDDTAESTLTLQPEESETYTVEAIAADSRGYITTEKHDFEAVAEPEFTVDITSVDEQSNSDAVDVTARVENEGGADTQEVTLGNDRTNEFGDDISRQFDDKEVTLDEYGGNDDSTTVTLTSGEFRDNPSSTTLVVESEDDDDSTEIAHEDEDSSGSGNSGDGDDGDTAYVEYDVDFDPPELEHREWADINGGDVHPDSRYVGLDSTVSQTEFIDHFDNVDEMNVHTQYTTTESDGRTYDDGTAGEVYPATTGTIKICVGDDRVQTGRGGGDLYGSCESTSVVDPEDDDDDRGDPGDD